jgi:hypothetical protein
MLKEANENRKSYPFQIHMEKLEEIPIRMSEVDHLWGERKINELLWGTMNYEENLDKMEEIV